MALQELTRVGLTRIIVPSLYHPQYVDCARLLTRKNEPDSFVASTVSIAKPSWVERIATLALCAICKRLATAH